MKQSANAVPLIVASDASMSGCRNRSTSGWAWIDETGRYSAGIRRGRSILALELHAMWQGLRASPVDRPVVLMTDCRPAIEQLQRVLETGVVPDRRGRVGARDASEALHRLVLLVGRRHAEVRWVKGHDGHPLNDAADRMALQVRRAGGVSRIEGLLARIAAEAVSGETLLEYA